MHNPSYDLHTQPKHVGEEYVIQHIINAHLLVCYTSKQSFKSLAPVCNSGKRKFRPITCHEGTEGVYRYSSTLYLPSTLDGVSCQRHAPAALPPRKRNDTIV